MSPHRKPAEVLPFVRRTTSKQRADNMAGRRHSERICDLEWHDGDEPESLSQEDAEEVIAEAQQAAKRAAAPRTPSVLTIRHLLEIWNHE